MVARHGEQLRKVRLVAGELLVILNTEQHVRRTTAIGDEYRPAPCCLLRTARILIELAAGNRSDGHGRSPARNNVETLLHCAGAVNSRATRFVDAASIVLPKNGSARGAGASLGAAEGIAQSKMALQQRLQAADR